VEPMAVDVVAAELTGLAPETIWTLSEAKRSTRPWSSLDDIELCGALLSTLRPRAFKPAKNTAVHFGVPKILQRPLRRALSARPVVDLKKCRRCGICVDSCPPHAMAIRNDRLYIDEERCILCFCCHELCPYGALHSQQGLILRISQTFDRIRRR
ncbi:MAG: 4Fe-4S binding protein, partial [Desulfuromonadales bacterium]|nr:4Fe-4S binding protein [Desulfuromonadales bacterium]